MKERRAAEELMLQNMVLSENGARRLETAAADAEARAASDAGRRKPRVFVKPCELCLGIRAEAAKSRDPRAGVKLCTRCQIKARDLAAAEVRRVREEEAAAAAAAAEAEAAAWPKSKPRRDAADPSRGREALERDLRRMEKTVALARTPEERVTAAQGSAAQAGDGSGRGGEGDGGEEGARRQGERRAAGEGKRRRTSDGSRADDEARAVVDDWMMYNTTPTLSYLRC